MRKKKNIMPLSEFAGYAPIWQINGSNESLPSKEKLARAKVKVAEHSFQVPIPNSPLLLNYLCFGTHFLQESRLNTEVFILAF